MNSLRAGDEAPNPAGHITGSGETLWLQARAADAARALAARSEAIIGGEIYLRNRVAWASFLRDWTASPRLGEAWDIYVARCLAEALAAVSSGLDLKCAPGEELMYFFATLSPPSADVPGRGE
jgi:hypothetical protein